MEAEETGSFSGDSVYPRRPRRNHFAEVFARVKFSVMNFCLVVFLGNAGSGNVVEAADSNLVGYVNVANPEGYALIANPLWAQENRVDEVFFLTPLAEGTRLIKLDGSNWVANEVVGGFWTVPEMTLSPGEGALLRSPTNWTQTWVGDVLQGELKVLIPAGHSLRGSPVSQAGRLSEVLQFPKIAGTKISRVDSTTGQFVLWATCTDAGWEPEEPVLSLGEGFYVEAPHEFVWTRLFTVNGQLPDPAVDPIVVQPQSQQINLGDILSLSVEATNPNALFYQWQRNGNDILGATGATLLIPNAGPEDLGSYWVRIWDLDSLVWSEIATVEWAGSSSRQLTNNADSAGRSIGLTPQTIVGRRAALQVW